MRGGELWWASLPDPIGSGPGFRRPVLIVRSNEFNANAIGTVICAVISSNLRLERAPGNVRIRARTSGLSRDSIVNVSQLITVDKQLLAERIGRLAPNVLRDVELGIRLVLAV